MRVVAVGGFGQQPLKAIAAHPRASAFVQIDFELTDVLPDCRKLFSRRLAVSHELSRRLLKLSLGCLPARLGLELFGLETGVAERKPHGGECEYDNGDDLHGSPARENGSLCVANRVRRESAHDAAVKVELHPKR